MSILSPAGVVDPPPPPELLPSSALRQVFHTVSVRSLTLACRFALVVLITKTLSPSDYGAYSLVSTVAALGVALCGLNLAAYVYRAVPGLPGGEQLRILKTTLLFETVASSAIVLIVVATGFLPLSLRYLNAAGYREVFVLGLVVLVSLIVAAELTSFFQAQARLERANWIDFLAQAGWVLPLIALRFAGVHISIRMLLYAQIAAGAGVVIYAARHIDLAAWWRALPDWRILRTGLAFSVPIIVPTIGVNSARFADRLILSHYGSVADVGVYSFAAVFVNTLYSFSAGVICGTFGPRIFAAHNRGDYARRDMLQTYMLKIALGCFVAPLIIMCFAARPFVVLLARPEYAGAAVVMPLLGVSSLILVLGYPASYLLTLKNRVVLLAGIDIVGTLVGLGSDLVLIPRYSYFGAAIGAILGLATTASLQYAFSGMFSLLKPEVIFSLHEEMSVMRRCVRRLREAVA